MKRGQQAALRALAVVSLFLSRSFRIPVFLIKPRDICLFVKLAPVFHLFSRVPFSLSKSLVIGYNGYNFICISSVHQNPRYLSFFKIGCTLDIFIFVSSHILQNSFPFLNWTYFSDIHLFFILNIFTFISFHILFFFTYRNYIYIFIFILYSIFLLKIQDTRLLF